jgi:hypothetical protein
MVENFLALFERLSKPLLFIMDKVCLRSEQHRLDLDVEPGLSLPFSTK